MQPKSTNLSTRPAKRGSASSVEVSVLLHVHSWIFFLRITLMSGLLLLVTGWALPMSLKERVRPGVVSFRLVGWYTRFCFLAYSF